MSLVGWVTLVGDDGQPHPFGPDDEVPAWARARITNPGAWSDGLAPEVEEDGQAPPTPPASAVNPNDDDLEPPPMGGPGSGAAAWREYAAAYGVEVAPDASREDVIEALRAADVPVD